MADKTIVDIETLRQLLSCDPDTGCLTWRHRPDGPPEWNTRYAGKEAFTSKTVYGYKQGSVLGRSVMRAHRVIWAIVHGEWPETIDHINGVRDDNRLCNLRDVSQSQNTKNRSKSTRNTSGVIGVWWNGKKWVAEIMVDYRKVNLGHFSSLEDATNARRSADLHFAFHENHGRDVGHVEASTKPAA